MAKPFSPLLSATIEPEIAVDQLKLLSYPVIASPKLDGIRGLVHAEGLKSRSMKLLPNKFIRSKLERPELVGLDGELIVGARSGDGVMSRAQSGVMSQDGEPDFIYWVFDIFTEPTISFTSRQAILREKYGNDEDDVRYPYVRVLDHCMLHNVEEVLAYEEKCLGDGYEGIMLRFPGGGYKYGRSTFNQQILIKMKRFTDDEAVIAGFEELYRNQNEQVINPMGLAKRSSHNAGMIPGGTLGKFILHHPKWGDFSCGSGLDDATRAQVWANKEKYLGKQVSFKYQAYGSQDKPRIPIFKGFRGVE
jgi:DNA ligase-1